MEDKENAKCSERDRGLFLRIWICALLLVCVSVLRISGEKGKEVADVCRQMMQEDLLTDRNFFTRDSFRKKFRLGEAVAVFGKEQVSAVPAEPPVLLPDENSIESYYFTSNADLPQSRPVREETGCGPQEAFQVISYKEARPANYNRPAAIGVSLIEPVPLRGNITSPFGPRVHPISKKQSFHHGIDLKAPYRTKIHAAADGIVSETGENRGYGKYIIVQHDEYLFTFYGHCSRITAQKGENVSKGDTIALVGSTGISTGNHLHFEIRFNGNCLDPALYLS